MNSRVPSVAIVGRTNVGKSTLFNRLAGRDHAVVEDYHGVTRDRNCRYIDRYSFPFTIIDTGGLAGEDNSSLEDAIRAQAGIAVEEADLVLVLFDGLYGLHPHDSEVCKIIRNSNKPVIWIVNKCEKKKKIEEAVEFYGLGIEQYLCISASHNIGIKELIARIEAKLGEGHSRRVESDGNESRQCIRIAVIGRPNVGKSTLVNRILGEERLITSPLAGTTRDAIDIELTRDGQRYVIADTAGLRRKSKVPGLTPERYSNLRALKALARCNIALLVIDAEEEQPVEQDIKLAGLAHERGRGLVIVVNKWDAVSKDHRTAREFQEKIKMNLKFARYAPVLFVSALTGKRCPSVLKTAKEVYLESVKRIETPEVNRVLKRAFDRRPPPLYRGSRIKLYYAAQVDIAPPSFALFVNYPRKINFSYQRYLKNAIRERYCFKGCDIKLFFRSRKRSDMSS